MKFNCQGRFVTIAFCTVVLVHLATVTPAAANVSSLTLSPATITGGSGGTALGTVTISAPAPAGGHEVDLTSSNTDLAASTERIVIPEGATSATFVVGTNALYRAYSGLAFSVTITATSRIDGTSASAILNVTAQAIPGPFTGGTASTDANATAGNICGGAFGAGNADERGILYDCRFTTPGTFSVCSFLQECLSGCQTQSAPLLNQRDICVTTPPVPIAVSPEIMEGGRRASGTVFLSAPAAPLTSANVSASPGGEASPLGTFSIAEGATSAPFDVDTFEVAVPAFLQVRADLAISPQQKFVQDYLAVVPAPGSTPPSGPLAVFSVDTTPMAVVQGNPSIGTVVLNGVAPSGGATVSLFTDNPAVTVPATVIVDAGQTATSFPVTTSGVATTTPVTITANFGGVSRTTRITVSPFIFSSMMPALTDLAVTPANVVGGQRSIGRVTMTGAAPDPSDGAVSIALTSSNEAAVVVARNVTVGHGGTFADFRIRTFRVTTTTIVTITATFNGVSRSATLTVTPSGPPPALALSTISVNPTSVQGGNPSTGTATLNQAAPAGGALVSLSTSNTVATPPANVTVPAGQTSANFEISTTAVTVPTNATITGTLNGGTRSATLTVNPPPASASVSALSVSPTTVVGGESATGTVTLTAAAPAGGMVVSLSDDSPAVSVPASVNVPGGATSVSFTVTTTSVTTSTSATISATGGGTTRTALLTVNPPPTPAAPTLVSPAQNATPAQPVFFDWSDVTHATSYEIQIDDSSTIAAPFVTSATVTASQTSIGGLPARRLWWRVRARNAAGVFGPFSATRRFEPQASTTAALSSVSVNPTSVVGGNASSGTATLTAAAPSGGAVVSLSSSNTAVATVPASVTIAAGATSANFTVTTSSVTASTSVTIGGTYNGTTRSTTLTVNPPAQNVTLTVTATGRSGERVTSNPAGINVAVGSMQSAPFAVGTSITLSVSNNRDAIWSGACSSGGNKTKTCTFTLNANASVTANVQ
jgi:hypothetical protein